MTHEEGNEVLRDKAHPMDGSGWNGNPCGNTPGRGWAAMMERFARRPQIEASVHGADSRDVGLSLSRCLSLDLEVGKKDRRIHALAGVPVVARSSP